MQAGPLSGARGAEDPLTIVNSKSEPFSCNKEKKKSIEEEKGERENDFLCSLLKCP